MAEEVESPMNSKMNYKEVPFLGGTTSQYYEGFDSTGLPLKFVETGERVQTEEKVAPKKPAKKSS